MSILFNTCLCEIISRKTLFDNPKYSMVTISPDGTQIAYLAPNDFGISNVFVRSILTGKERPATFEMKNHISGGKESMSSKSYLCLKDISGLE